MPEVDLDGTIRRIVDQVLAVQPQGNAELVQEYLKAVALFTGDRTGTSTGMLVTVDGEGGIQWVAVDDIRDLGDTPRQFFERKLSLELELERSLREKELSRSGPSIGL